MPYIFHKCFLVFVLVPRMFPDVRRKFPKSSAHALSFPHTFSEPQLPPHVERIYSTRVNHVPVCSPGVRGVPPGEETRKAFWGFEASWVFLGEGCLGFPGASLRSPGASWAFLPQGHPGIQGNRAPATREANLAPISLPCGPSHHEPSARYKIIQDTRRTKHFKKVKGGRGGVVPTRKWTYAMI